jgi:sugar O-acyltransferase (sialic acid O-acetyltransferase NeuD family)
MKKLVIYGAGHFSVLKTVNAINRSQPTWEIIGFLDDTDNLKGQNFHGYPVLGGRELLPDLARHDDTFFINNVISHWSSTSAVAGLLEKNNCRVPNLIHPLIDMSFVTIGHGCLLPEGCIIGFDTVLGNYVNVRMGVIISHNVTAGDFVFIGPGTTIGSGVVLKTKCYIGAGATVMLNRTIGENSIVGAGAVVTKDVRDNAIVKGIPAQEGIKTGTASE